MYVYFCLNLRLRNEYFLYIIDILFTRNINIKYKIICSLNKYLLNLT